MKKKEFVKQVLSWYDIHKASFPWRTTKNPYRVLVTEMLLRKTTRKQVRSLYPVFFERFPNVKVLASADVSTIKKIITPLGMEKIRSKLLHEMAEKITSYYSSEVPLEKKQLMELPGVGSYISNAVMLLIGKKRVPLVDTNSMRIVERVFNGNDRTSTRATVEKEKFISDLLPRKRFIDFNLAMLDFASEVCIPRTPKCGSCPLKTLCVYTEKLQILNKTKGKFSK